MHKQVCPTCNVCYHTLAHTPTTVRPRLWLALPAQREEAEIQEEGQAHAEHDVDHYPEEAPLPKDGRCPSRYLLFEHHIFHDGFQVGQSQMLTVRVGVC